MISFDRISFGVLAGGRASRLGGADKAQLRLNDASLLERVARAWSQPFRERLLSYNRPAGPQVQGWRCVPDIPPGQGGPMSGLEALLAAANGEWLLTVPVDCRDLPPDLPERLAMTSSPVACVVTDADRLQPLVGLWHVARLRSAVADALAADDRAVHALCRRLDVAVLDIAPHRLGNLNSPEDFSEA